MTVHRRRRRSIVEWRILIVNVHAHARKRFGQAPRAAAEIVLRKKRDRGLRRLRIRAIVVRLVE